jgi:hypothetical protein
MPLDKLSFTLARPKYIENNNDAMISAAQTWINNRIGKKYPTYKGWTIEALCKGLRKIENIVAIVRMVDPLKSFFFNKKDEFRNYATNKVTFSEMVSICPDNDAINSALDFFYESVSEIENEKELKIYCIGPQKAQMLRRIDSVKTSYNLEAIMKHNVLLIQVNIMEPDYEQLQRNIPNVDHYFVIEINLDEAKKLQEFQLHIADSVDNDPSNLDFIAIRISIIESKGIVELLSQLRPGFDITYHRADNVSTQNNSNDCGIHGARRIFSYLKYGRVIPCNDIDAQIGDINAFRLFIAETLLLKSTYVSMYVCYTGQSDTGNFFSYPTKAVLSPIKKLSGAKISLL